MQSASQPRAVVIKVSASASKYTGKVYLSRNTIVQMRAFLQSFLNTVQPGDIVVRQNVVGDRIVIRLHFSKSAMSNLKRKVNAYITSAKTMDYITSSQDMQMDRIDNYQTSLYQLKCLESNVSCTPGMNRYIIVHLSYYDSILDCNIHITIALP